MTLLPDEASCKAYINADLIAGGLSPFDPEQAAIHAGKLMLSEISRCVSAGISFAFETTLSGMGYQRKIQLWKNLGYKIVLYYFTLPSVEMAIERVKFRVSQGGHSIPEAVIRRRFSKSVRNFEVLYKPIVDVWAVFDTSGASPTMIESSTSNG